MNALTLLKADHDKVKKMLDRGRVDDGTWREDPDELFGT